MESPSVDRDFLLCIAIDQNALASGERFQKLRISILDVRVGEGVHRVTAWGQVAKSERVFLVAEHRDYKNRAGRTRKLRNQQNLDLTRAAGKANVYFPCYRPSHRVREDFNGRWGSAQLNG